MKSYENDDGRILIKSLELINEFIHAVAVCAPNIETERMYMHTIVVNNVIILGDCNMLQWYPISGTTDLSHALRVLSDVTKHIKASAHSSLLPQF